MATSPTPNEASASVPSGLRIVTGDLILGGRIAEYGRKLGYEIRTGPRLRTADWQRLECEGERMVVDLAAATDWTADFGRLSPAAQKRVAAYAAHVRVELLKSARAAGVRAVFTRSQLDKAIPTWLTSAVDEDSDFR